MGGGGSARAVPLGNERHSRLLDETANHLWPYYGLGVDGMLVTREKPCTRRCRSGHPVPKTWPCPEGVAMHSDVKEPHIGEVAPLFEGVTSTSPFGLPRL